MYDKFSSVLMLPVWQEAASVTKERNVIGLEGIRFSAARVHQCGHWEGCWLLVCSAAKKASYVGQTGLGERKLEK